MGAERPLFLSVFSFYGGLCRKVLADRLLFSSFVVAATLHGIGHAGTALAAGLLGRAISTEPPLISSTFRFVCSPATLAFVGVLATAVKGAGATVGATLQSRLAQNVASVVRRQLAGSLLASGSRLPPGQLSARLVVRLREVERGVEDGFLAGLRSTLTLAPLGVALYCVSSIMALGALLVLAPFAVALSRARRAWKGSYRRALSLAEGLHQELDELVVHMDVWRAYGAGEPVCRTLDTLGEQVAATASRAEGSRAALSSANELLAAAALLGCIWAAHTFSLPLGDGTFVAFAVLLFMTYRPLRDLGDARSALERGREALTSLDDVARVGSAPVVGARPLPRRWAPQVLVVDGVGVMRGEGDDGGRRATSVTSFVARPGEIVAVVGPTGSGKTTLLRALLGLEPAAVGVVRYGGEDLTHAGVGPSERPFAWVPQDAPVLAGTLADNVLLGRADDGGGLAAALDSIGAGKLATEWADVELGAAGRPVSGGERKWIALARAISSGLPVLLLDEPTAGLDADSQERVFRALRELRHTRTILLVSHQAEAVGIADRVVELGSSCPREREGPRIASSELGQAPGQN